MNILKLERSIALLKPIIWKMPMNKKREAYITLLTAAQKQLPKEVNLVVEEHFIPNCPFSQQIPKGWACPVCGCEVKASYICLKVQTVRENGCKNIGLLWANKSIKTESLRRLF